MAYLMVRRFRIIYLLATAIMSFGDRSNILRRPLHNFTATAKQSFDGRQKMCGRACSHHHNGFFMLYEWLLHTIRTASFAKLGKPVTARITDYHEQKAWVQWQPTCTSN